MIRIKQIDILHQADINIPNEPFEMFGKIEVAYVDGQWSHRLVRFAPEHISHMCFPDEIYQYDEVPGRVFLGAYDGDTCVGLAVLQPSMFKYMYLYDLKVNKSYRGRHIGKQLMETARAIAAEQGYCGIYTLGQDNNPAACLFYLHSGFYIGGFDANVYRHTNQEGKADIIFYSESDR
jgi:ribosomal protein S18 acetylase RimI-like enzyme